MLIIFITFSLTGEKNLVLDQRLHEYSIWNLLGCLCHKVLHIKMHCGWGSEQNKKSSNPVALHYSQLKTWINTIWFFLLFSLLSCFMYETCLWAENNFFVETGNTHKHIYSVTCYTGIKKIHLGYSYTKTGGRYNCVAIIT